MKPLKRRETVSVVPLFFRVEALPAPYRPGGIEVVIVDIETIVPGIPGTYGAGILSPRFIVVKTEQLSPLPRHFNSKTFL
jgi:hypothetical protein